MNKELREQNKKEQLDILDPESHPVLGRFLDILESSRREAILDYMRRSLAAKYEVASRAVGFFSEVTEEFRATRVPPPLEVEMGDFDVEGADMWQETLNAAAGDANDSVVDEAWNCLQYAAESWGGGDLAEGERMFAMSKNPGTTILRRASIEELQDA